MQFSARRTDEPSDCYFVGQGWRKNPKTQPWKAPHREKWWFAELVPKTQTQSHTVTSKNLKETQLPVAGETVTIMITSISTVFLLPHW